LPKQQKAKQQKTLDLASLKMPSASVTQIQQGHTLVTATPAVTQKTPQSWDEREEREYLRRQSLLDMDVENKRASSAFDLAERANRMA
jgi:hypothetical protein